MIVGNATEHAPRETKDVSTDAAGRPNLEMYALVLSGIQQQIRFADAKAGFIAAVNALLFGFLAVRFDAMLAAYARLGAGSPVMWFNVLAQSLYLMAAAAAVGSILIAVMPRFSEFAPHGKLFFRQIVRDYGKDCARYVRDTNRLTDDEWAMQLGTEIVEVSHIAAAKHQLMRQAVWATLLAFVLWRVALLAIALLPMAGN